MHRSIDMKSVLIGGLLVVLILCVAGAVPFLHPEWHGRFQIETNDYYAFILDSATGQVWSSFFAGTGVGHDPNFHARKTFDEDVPFIQ